MFRPRPKQQEVLDYERGKMGVSAVPGSGKTRTLSALAAKLVAGNYLGDDQEVLVVTLVNSAVDHFARQVGAFVQEAGLLPNLGYRVRTLHGLCNDIVRERPGLVGLADDFQIIDERESNSILTDAIEGWLRANPDSIDPFLDADTDSGRRDWLLREQWPGIVRDVATAFIKQAKDEQILPDQLEARLDRMAGDFLAGGSSMRLAQMATAIYAGYQRGLSYRGAVDFQDLIRLALKALTLDEAYLARLRQRWPYILEDESQDSSQLQEQILRLLTGDHGNWVRVGDPNQAIYETFTTARPELLREFLNEPDVQAKTLPNSGRSALPIIDLANFLIDWTLTSHPSLDVRRRQPLTPPRIEPSPPGDPQPNPPAEEASIYLYGKALTPAEEVDIVVTSLERWLPENPDKTVAVLVPRNRRGFAIVEALKARRESRLEFIELLQSTTTTREAAGALANILRFLSQPGDPRMLARVYEVWRREDRDDEEAFARTRAISKLLSACPRVEDYIWPQLGRDWLEDAEELAELAEVDPEARPRLEQYRTLVRRWHEAVVLPIDQLLLILAQDLFTTAADLAIAHSLAVVLRQIGDHHPEYQLPDFTEELGVIAKNERRFMGMDDNARGFDPAVHRGKVVIATMHSAKGLEWDRVYLTSVNNYDFPSLASGDTYQAEKRFVRGGLNLQAEALAQLRTLKAGGALRYVEGEATAQAREDYVSERLRLFYVGITRARRDLIVTFNTGQRGDSQQALPFVALQHYWEEQSNDHAAR
jgi:DNA helicase-2/ATP-dependent DNA helicase PcrA